nr:DUF3265 domain-containing protein [Vibrio parahaemolyticus]
MIKAVCGSIEIACFTP